MRRLIKKNNDVKPREFVIQISPPYGEKDYFDRRNPDMLKNKKEIEDEKNKNKYKNFKK